MPEPPEHRLPDSGLDLLGQMALSNNEQTYWNMIIQCSFHSKKKLWISKFSFLYTVYTVDRWGLDDATKIDSVSKYRLLSLLCGTVGSEHASGSNGPRFESRKTTIHSFKRFFFIMTFLEYQNIKFPNNLKPFLYNVSIKTITVELA